jgi:hypothetical protein
MSFAGQSRIVALAEIEAGAALMASAIFWFRVMFIADLPVIACAPAVTGAEIHTPRARPATPSRVVPRPSVRLAQWTAVLVTLLTALLSAAAAFTSSVPGAERSLLQRAIPLLAGSLWAIVLMGLLAQGGDSVRRILALPIHVACVIEIAAFGLLPGWALFTMLRHAAPLQPTWSAALAALSATALGAVATQIVCPIDDPAHHLMGHFVPVVLLTFWGTLARRRSLDWR